MPISYFTLRANTRERRTPAVLASTMIPNDAKSDSITLASPPQRYAVLLYDEARQEAIPDRTMLPPLPLGATATSMAGSNVFVMENPCRCQCHHACGTQPATLPTPATTPQKSKPAKKKSKMHPLVKGIIVLTVGPFVMAGAAVVAAGSVVYGAGQVIAGIGDLLMGGPLRKKAMRAWKHRNDYGEEEV